MLVIPPCPHSFGALSAGDAARHLDAVFRDGARRHKGESTDAKAHPSRRRRRSVANQCAKRSGERGLTRPYKYGKIQFTTKFFRKIIAEQLPEVPSEDLFRAEDLAQKSESARRGTYPPAGVPVAPLGVRKAFLLPLIALGAFVVVGAGIWVFSRGNEAPSVAPSALASAQVSAPLTAPAAVTQEAPAVNAPVATAPTPATSAASSQGTSDGTVSGSGVGKLKRNPETKKAKASGTKPANGVYFEPD